MSGALRGGLLLVFVTTAACGTRVREQMHAVQLTITSAREAGAYTCAPKELARAEAHIEFAKTELDLGEVIRARHEVTAADDNARRALELSPKDKCSTPVVKFVDTDGDGVPDDVDRCPTEREDKDGWQDEDGCPDPDNDLDGVPDAADKCPNEPEDKDGFQDEDGCPDPDNDGDGVPDGEDQCPDAAGDAEHKGCPAKDSDSDGVFDHQDRCPQQAGPADNEGCPRYKLVEVQKDRIAIRQKVHFASARSTILPDSFAMLNEIADIIKNRSEMHVRVEGHTDSRGKPGFNLLLSQKRADAVRAYLLKKGVSPAQLESKGFGSQQPVSDNRTAAGRESNRRVEFMITPRSEPMVRASAVIARLLPLLVLLAAVAPARAADDVEKQVARLSKRAMEDYDALEFESSRRTLVDAVAALRSAGLDDTALAARVYMNLGIVYVTGFKDRKRGQQQFVAALKIQGDVRLDPAMATPEIEEAWAAAQRAVPPSKRGNAGKSTPAEPVLPGIDPTPPVDSSPKGFNHAPVDDSRGNTSIIIRATTGSDLDVSRVTLFYRGAGREDFVNQPMLRSGHEWSGAIPAEATLGSMVQYYIEVRDTRGRSLSGSGSSLNPHLVRLSGGPRPGEIEDDPLERERVRKKRLEAEAAGKKRDHMFVIVTPGFGFGYQPAGNHTEVAWQYQPTGMQANSYIHQPVGSGGFALAPFHLGLEAGGLITRAFALSLYARIQLVTGANAETVGRGTAGVTEPTSKAWGAWAIMLRARYRFMSGKFHPFIQLNGGYGTVRHTLDVSSAQSTATPLVDAYSAREFNMADSPKDPNDQVSDGAGGMRKRFPQQTVCTNPTDCKDTLVLGSVLLGGGLGIWYDIIPHLFFVFDANVLGAIGTRSGDTDGQSGLNIDLNVGLGASFL